MLLSGLDCREQEKTKPIARKRKRDRMNEKGTRETCERDNRDAREMDVWNIKEKSISIFGI